MLLIDKHGKQFHYLQFLSIICVCKRDAIARNQEAICRAIFDDSKVLDKVRNEAHALLSRCGWYGLSFESLFHWLSSFSNEMSTVCVFWCR